MDYQNTGDEVMMEIPPNVSMEEETDTEDHAEMEIQNSFGM